VAVVGGAVVTVVGKGVRFRRRRQFHPRSTPRTVVREARAGRCVVHFRSWSLWAVSTCDPPCERGLGAVLGAGAISVTSWAVGDWFGVLVAHCLFRERLVVIYGVRMCYLASIPLLGSSGAPHCHPNSNKIASVRTGWSLRIARLCIGAVCLVLAPLVTSSSEPRKQWKPFVG